MALARQTIASVAPHGAESFSEARASEQAFNGESTSASITSIGAYGDTFALTHRRAARLNASQITEAELDGWLAERSALLDKVFAETITRREQGRLNFVEWNIDRIEDARSGEFLDMLEGFALKYESFLGEVRDFKRQLDSMRGRR